MKVTTELRMMVTLGVAGVISGLALVGVYLATRPTIERNEAAALQAAIFEVIPGAMRQAPMVVRGETLTAVEAPEPKEPAIYAGYGAGDVLLGYAIPASGGGFQDTIGLIFGVAPGGRQLTGMRVLRSLETPGLGDKIIKDEGFVTAFEGLHAVPPIEAVKKGKGGAPHQVDAISGATISSKAVVKIINGANATWLPLLPPPLLPPALLPPALLPPALLPPAHPPEEAP